MRSIETDDLGVNHKLHKIHKRNSLGLSHRDLRETILKTKPDFIYVHLGINDVHVNRPLKEIMANFGEFMLFIEEECKQAKLIFSMPLLNGNKTEYPMILDLREELYNWITTIGSMSELANRDLLFNPNTNFFRRDNKGSIIRTSQATDLFKTREGDYTHLNDVGQRVILANMRHSIHYITRGTQRPHRRDL